MTNLWLESASPDLRQVPALKDEFLLPFKSWMSFSNGIIIPLRKKSAEDMKIDK